MVHCLTLLTTSTIKSIYQEATYYHREGAKVAKEILQFMNLKERAAFGFDVLAFFAPSRFKIIILLSFQNRPL